MVGFSAKFSSFTQYQSRTSHDYVRLCPLDGKGGMMRWWSFLITVLRTVQLLVGIWILFDCYNIFFPKKDLIMFDL